MTRKYSTSRTLANRRVKRFSTPAKPRTVRKAPAPPKGLSVECPTCHGQVRIVKASFSDLKMGIRQGVTEFYGNHKDGGGNAGGGPGSGRLQWSCPYSGMPYPKMDD